MYSFVIHDTAGKAIERFGDVLAFDSQRRINGVGSLSLSLPASHPAVASIGHLTMVALYRREPTQNMPWTLENCGLVLSRRWVYPPGGLPGARLPYFACCALHPNWLLSTRIVYWKAATPGRSSFTDIPAETIAKTLVAANLGDLSGAEDGRERSGRDTLMPVGVQEDSGSGPRLSWYCAYHNLLSTLQRLAGVSGADFDLVPVDGGCEFRWYPAGLGGDRSAQVIFSIERGNLANPVYELDRQSEKTVAVVGGRGEGILRQTLHVVSADFSPANDIEGFTTCYQGESAAGMQAVAGHYLARHAAPARLTFDVLQMPSTCYGVHYFLGDRVTVRNPFTVQDFSARVLSARIEFRQPQDGQAAAPLIQIDLGTAPSAEAWPEVLEELQAAESGEVDGLDGARFNDNPAEFFFLDAGLLGGAYLCPGISGGTFHTPPG